MEMTSSGSTPPSVFPEITSTVAGAFSFISASHSHEIEASYSALDVSVELSKEVFIISYTTSNGDVFSTSYTTSSEKVFRTSYATSSDEVFITNYARSSEDIFGSSTAAEAETAVTLSLIHISEPTRPP